MVSVTSMCAERLAPTLLTTNERSEQLIEGLLILARSEQEVSERLPLDLADVAAVALEHERPEARERGMTISTDLRPAPVEGSAVLEVENPGEELRQYEIDGMFEPFRRGDGRVSTDRGAGLGLSIVRSVAQAHGGTVQASPREGGGLVVRVELPARHDPATSDDD